MIMLDSGFSPILCVRLPRVFGRGCALCGYFSPITRKTVLLSTRSCSVRTRQPICPKTDSSPRGIGSLGYTIQRPTEDRFLMTRAELENKMTVLLGGRAAEHVVFEHLSTGAADDLAKVTDIARSMVMRFGMDEQLGHVAYEAERTAFLGTAGPMVQERRYSEETAREIDRAVRETLDAAFKRAVAILREKRQRLEEGAQALLQKETLVEEDLAKLLGAPLPAPALA